MIGTLSLGCALPFVFLASWQQDKQMKLQQWRYVGLPAMIVHFRYARYVLRHKWYVFVACLHYGLLWRGIKHDWSKFLPSEWFPYATYFYGKKRPDIGTTGYNHALHQDDDAFNMAWNYHQKRNDHHWQYWVLMYDDGKVFCLPMPDLCRKEMLADWRGAGMAQGKPNTWEWYEANKGKMQLHEDTRAWVEAELVSQEHRYIMRSRLGI